MRIHSALAFLFLLLLAANAAQASQVYKWVDKDGKVHYSNTPPPEAAQTERQVLDEHGNVTATLSAPKSPEEIAAEQQRQAELEQQRKLAAEQEAKDRLLLQTYTVLDEIIMARDGRLAALDAQIRVVSGSIGSLEIQVAELAQRAEVVKQAGNPVPEALQQQIDDARKELLENQKFLISRQEEQEDIRRKFGADIARFRELKGL